MKNQFQKISSCLLLMSLIACGGSNEVATQSPQIQALLSQTKFTEQVDGVTPFIKILKLNLENYNTLNGITFTIAPKPGTFSKAVTVEYRKAYLDKKAYYNSTDKQMSLPIFGLYAGYKNQVTVTLKFIDGSTKTEQLEVPTAAFDDTTKVYSAIDIKQARTATPIGFDFVAIKSALTTPVVIDTDGNIRWIGAGVSYSASTTFSNNAFFIGAQKTTSMAKIEFDGSSSSVVVPSNIYTNFHHELNLGKTGFLAEFDGTMNNVKILESILVEINEKGEVLKEWNMGTILKDVIQSAGGDPSNFVRDGIDWFHMNSAIYNRANDSLIISSRENFVMSIDYETGKLKWLLGDTTKHWYVDYPSLRPYSLTLNSGKTPIGQHALSIASDGNLLLFNDGLNSMNHPTNAAAGISRTFSAASKYSINENAKTADEVWTFENGQKVFSDICSSVYEGQNNSYLVNYSVAYNRTKAKLVGIDSTGKIHFDFEYPNVGCNTSWNSFPIALDAMVFN